VGVDQVPDVVRAEIGPGDKVADVGSISFHRLSAEKAQAAGVFQVQVFGVVGQGAVP